MIKIINYVKKRIAKRYYYFCLSLFDLLVGIYGLFHLNYLDDPKITVIKHKENFDFISGMTDDLWFNSFLALVGIVLLISILIRKNKLANTAYFISIFMAVLVCIAFSIRGVYAHCNIDWAVSLVLILMAIKGSTGDGDDK